MRLASRWVLAAACLAACGGDDDGGGGGGDADARPGSDSAPDDPDAGQTFTLTTYIGDEQAPLRWIARRDGAGDWETITSPDGVYSIELSSDRFGLAWVCEAGAARSLYYFHATTGEFPTLTRSCPAAVAAPTGTLSFQVTDLDENGSAVVSFGNGGGSMSMADDTVDIDLQVGDWDFVTTVKPNDITIGRVAITTGAIDQGQTTAIQISATGDTVAVTNFTATVAGIDPEAAVVSAHLLSAGGTRAPLHQPAEGDYATVPTASLREGDLHLVTATAVLDNVIRVAGTYFRDGKAVSLELPAGFAPELVAAATEPYLRLAATWDEWPGAELYYLDARQGFETTTRRVRWLATADWLSGGEAGGWTQPDLSGAAGWSDAWGMDPAEQVFWTLHAVKASDDGFAFEHLESEPPGDWDGEVVSRSSRTGFFSP